MLVKMGTFFCVRLDFILDLIDFPLIISIIDLTHDDQTTILTFTSSSDLRRRDSTCCLWMEAWQRPGQWQLTERQLAKQQLNEQQLTKQQLNEHQLNEQQFNEQQLNEQQFNEQQFTKQFFQPSNICI